MLQCTECNKHGKNYIFNDTLLLSVQLFDDKIELEINDFDFARPLFDDEQSFHRWAKMRGKNYSFLLNKRLDLLMRRRYGKYTQKWVLWIFKYIFENGKPSPDDIGMYPLVPLASLSRDLVVHLPFKKPLGRPKIRNEDHQRKGKVLTEKDIERQKNYERKKKEEECEILQRERDRLSNEKISHPNELRRILDDLVDVEIIEKNPVILDQDKKPNKKKANIFYRVNNRAFTYNEDFSSPEGQAFLHKRIEELWKASSECYNRLHYAKKILEERGISNPDKEIDKKIEEEYRKINSFSSQHHER
jgi:hypothetical protein